MTNIIFEQIKKINEYNQEFWSARDLMLPLGYNRWENFEVAITRAKESCRNSKQAIDDHFREATKMVELGSEAKREISDYTLSRYACYLIAQNGDPRKEEIALAQTYFAIQTRKQEIQELLIEDSKRIYLRDEMKVHNKQLAKTAKESGVFNYADFQDYGYMGLYGGMRQKHIHVKKKLKPNEKILDHMGSEELAANLFRATQAEAKLKRENIYGQAKASSAHYAVGKKVRDTIKELGGTGVTPFNWTEVVVVEGFFLFCYFFLSLLISVDKWKTQKDSIFFNIFEIWSRPPLLRFSFKWH